MFVSVIFTFFFFITVNVAEESEAPCPATWTLNEISKTCVKPYNDKKVSWKKARAICQREGGDLVVIKNSQMNDFVQGLLSLKRYWIGSRYNSTTKMMRYLDGEEMTPTFEAWAPRQPNNYRGKQECIEIIRKREGLWNDRSCRRRRHFVCEKPAVEKDQKDVTSNLISFAKCDAGWVYYVGDDSCLLYRNESRVTYDIALEDCHYSYGGSLVIIRDKKKDSFIKDNIIFQDNQEIHNDHIWLGLKRENFGGISDYVYVNGEDMGYYQPWAEGEPSSDLINGQCVIEIFSMEPSIKEIEWHTTPCTSTAYYICEV